MSIDRGLGLALALAAAVACVAWTWVSPSQSLPNERTRVYLTMALVERGEVRVDAEVKRFGKLIDLAKHGGHYYTDKAPGMSVLGVPVYAAARALAPDREWRSSDVLVLLRRALLLPLALLGLFALYRVLIELGASTASAALATLAWPLATTALHYAGAFYGHHVVAVMLVVSLRLALLAGRREGPAAGSGPPSEWGARLALLGAGACAGIAGLTEYQAGPACAVLAIWLLVRERARPLRVLAFALGVAPFVALLLAYNKAAFGSPFALSYTHVASAEFVGNHNHGIGGLDVPKLRAVMGLLFSPHRGLFVTIPITLLAIPGSVWLARKHRALGVALAVMICVQVVVIAGFDGWWGGWSYGPRLLLPVLGVAFVPVAFALDALRERAWALALVAALLIVGSAQSGLMKATFFEAPERLENPLFDIAVPALERGFCAPSLGHALGLSRCDGVVPGALLAALVLGAAWLVWTRGAAWRARLAAVVVACAVLGAALALTRQVPRSDAEELKDTMRYVRKWQAPDTPAKR